MRKDHLQVMTQGARPFSKQHLNTAGCIRATVSKGFSEPADGITVEVMSGMSQIERRETALINIEFKDGKMWSGSFDDLYGHLVSSKHITVKQFPNGIESWMKVHFEMCIAVNKSSDNEGSVAYNRFQEKGFTGLYELAEELTDMFEKKFEGTKYSEDSEWSDNLESFMYSQLN